MKQFFIVPAILLLNILHCFGQKPVIDTNAINNWVHTGEGKVSQNGQWFAYMLDRTYSSHSHLLFIGRTSKPSAATVFNNGSTFSFTANKGLALFMLPGDTLVMLELQRGSKTCVPGVKSYQLSKDRQWLAYVTGGQVMHLVNLLNSKQKIFPNAADPRFLDNSRGMVVRIPGQGDNCALQWISLADAGAETFWNGKSPDNLTFYGESKLAFTAIDSNKNKVIFYYEHGPMAKARAIVTSNSAGIAAGLTIDNLRYFTKDGNHLAFDLAGERPVKKSITMASLDIWSYTDVMLQSEQQQHLAEEKTHRYFAIVAIESGKMWQCGTDHEIISDFDNKDTLGVATVYKVAPAGSEFYWNRAGSTRQYLVSLLSGKPLTELHGYGVGMSPSGHYYIYFDKTFRDFYSYDIRTGKEINLTQNYPLSRIDTAYDEQPGPQYGELINTLNYGVSWLPGDKGFVVYDNYDAWLIDPSGKNAPKDLTLGYGRQHNMSFGMVARNKLLPGNGKLLLTGLDLNSRETAYYTIDLLKEGNPQLLSKGAYYDELQYDPDLDQPFHDGYAKAYLVQRESSEQSRNFYLTTDFRTFKKLTDVHPESAYNWITSELISGKSLSGYPLQGVIYKPENFDPAKRYPVIITYYEKLTDRIHKYKEPALSGSDLIINIPWFVSRGYIVVTPDIHYKIGEPGKSALSAVVSVASYLKGLPYTDPARMGIMGHSWGAVQTDYIVAHTGIFAAAFASSGFGDAISEYGSTAFSGGECLSFFSDMSQTRIGATLWARPDLYIENSPVFNAYAVSTPLLMMNNQQDGVVPYKLGVEYFIALRRLGKKVWMLQYDDGKHLPEASDMYDYTMRVNQFFDHYLKGSPAPIWMTRGIPALKKGTEDGFSYDQQISTPPPSPLIAPGKDPRTISFDKF